MMIDLALERKGQRTSLRFASERMVNAGYTGRNQAEVREHIGELAKKGIPGPPTTPTLYPVIRRALVKDPEIEVYSRETCGEAEYVLLIENENRIYVGMGSDHTDSLPQGSQGTEGQDFSEQNSRAGPGDFSFRRIEKMNVPSAGCFSHKPQERS